ncbi:MAG: hypothetical protein QXX77_09895 [Candidatus Methanosuratincola sp.]|jgi:hypothetical protein
MNDRTRLPFQAAVRYGESAPDTYGYACELGEDEIGIYCDRLLKQGTKIKIEVFVENEFVSLEGEVRWAYRSPEGGVYRTGIKLSTYDETLMKVYKRLKFLKRR